VGKKGKILRVYGENKTKIFFEFHQNVGSDSSCLKIFLKNFKSDYFGFMKYFLCEISQRENQLTSSRFE